MVAPVPADDLCARLRAWAYGIDNPRADDERKAAAEIERLREDLRTSGVIFWRDRAQAAEARCGDIGRAALAACDGVSYMMQHPAATRMQKEIRKRIEAAIAAAAIASADKAKS